MENLTLLMVFGAGFLSILSPCVLPVVPIVVAGGENDHKLRPLLIVSGLTLSFITMGVLSSLFGAFIGTLIFKIEKIVAILIIVSGLLLAFNINPFKTISFFSSIASKSRGRLNGFFLGFILGLVWIPCVGPILGSVLAMVASKGSAAAGVLYLLIYSIGFSLPLLVAGYFSHFFRSRISALTGKQRIISVISGILLIIIGLIILKSGMLFLGTIGF